MTKPTTDAGRRYSEQPPGSLDEWNVAILAIENEARANVTSHVTFPTPPSLDADALQQAVADHCHDSVDEGPPILLRHKHLGPFLTGDCGTAIAREYARLTTEGEKP